MQHTSSASLEAFRSDASNGERACFRTPSIFPGPAWLSKKGVRSERGELLDSVGVLQGRLNGRNDHSRFYFNQSDTNDGDAHPRVNDNPFVEHAVQNVDQAGARWGTLDRHRRIFGSG
jgi:hypothetical protein